MEIICIKYSICLIQKVTYKALFKANLDVINKKYILNNSSISSLAIVINNVLILNLDIEVIIL
jgi:hypothetical protein